MISLEKWWILTPWQKLPKIVGDLDKLIVAKGFKSFIKSNKSPNLFTLPTACFRYFTAFNADKITKCDKKRTLNFTQNESNVKKIKF